jgi:hypothetical protein
MLQIVQKRTCAMMNTAPENADFVRKLTVRKSVTESKTMSAASI